MIEAAINALLSSLQFISTALIPLSALLIVMLVSRKFTLKHFGPSVSYQLWALVPICLLLTQVPSLPFLFQETFSLVGNIQRFVVTSLSSEHKSSAGFSSLLSVFWFAGVLGLAMLIIASHQKHFARIFGNLAELTPSQENQLGSDLRTQHHPIIYTSSSISSPMITGFFRQKLILPQDFFTQYSATQRSLILAHETYHYGRFDIYWNYFAMLLLMAFWFHPLAWLAYYRFRQDQEISCDHAILSHKNEEDKLQYAKALVNTLEHQQLHIAYLSFGKFGDNKMMFERINQIRNSKVSNKLVAPMLIVGASLFMASSIQAADVPPPPMPPKVVKGENDNKFPKPPLPPKSAEAIKSMRPVVRVAPSYPEKAAAENIEGWVVLNFDIEKNGTIKEIKVVDSSPKGTFDESARKALAKWRYAPHEVKNANATIQLDFKLDSE